jgi:alpha-1,2-mannosyltransferase
MPARANNLAKHGLHVGGWLAFALSVAVYAHLSIAVQHQPFHVGARHLRFFDLRVYRGAALRLLHGRSIYDRPIVQHLGFTYPPFAALVFTPLALVSLGAAKGLVTVLNIAALVFTLRRTFAITRPVAGRRALIATAASTAWPLAALAAAAALWLEPVSVALGYGQVDLLIVALVVLDISRPDGARGKGAAIGIAAAIKLTPLLFLAYLLLSGRRRGALTGVLTFIATIAISFVLVPGDAGRYWGRLVFHSSRVGGAIDAGNQSLRGALARLLAERHPGLALIALIAAAALAGLLLAARSGRHGDEAVGFSLGAIVTLLASPVSWTHHWVLAVPALLLLLLASYERRAPSLAVWGTGVAAVGYSYLPELTMPDPRRRSLSHRVPAGAHQALVRHAHQIPVTGVASLSRDPYVVVGLLALAGAALTRLADRRIFIRRLTDCIIGWAPTRESFAARANGGLTGDLKPAGRSVAQDVTRGIEHGADDDRARVPAAAQGG